MLIGAVDVMQMLGNNRLGYGDIFSSAVIKDSDDAVRKFNSNSGIFGAVLIRQILAITKCL